MNCCLNYSPCYSPRACAKLAGKLAGRLLFWGVFLVPGNRTVFVELHSRRCFVFKKCPPAIAINRFLNTYIYINVNVYMYIYYLFIYADIHTYIHIYIYMYIYFNLTDFGMSL